MSATQPRSESEATPIFRRARPDDAVEMALATFVSGERVDMQSLATRLDVSPATLYRWFGSRAQLLDRAFALLSLDFATAARAAAHGEGDERVCDYARHIMVSAAGFEAMRSFVAREPQLALRLLLGKDGSVHRVVTEQTAEVVAETRSPEEAQAIDAHVHMIVQVATALVWATFMIGDAPEIDSAVELIRMVLASSRTGT